jgi:hypothetical protein
MNFILQLVDHVLDEGALGVEADQAATDDFNERLIEATKGTVWVTGCRSWYLNEDGIPAAWPWTLQRFRDEMAQPELRDFNLIA